MKVKEIIRECLHRLGEEDFLDTSDYDEAQQKILDKLLGILNLVYKEIATEYLPMKVEEEIVVVDNQIDICCLSYPIIYPIRVSKNGESMKIKTFCDYIKTKFSGKCLIEYCYMPENLKLDDDIQQIRLSNALLCTGILAIYYFQSRAFDLAKNYDTEYRSKASLLKYRGREMIINSRGWN